MTGNDLIKKFIGKGCPPYPVFIFRDENRRICGEYIPHLGSDGWSGGDRGDVLDSEILSWYMTWDEQDCDVVQIWITIGERRMSKVGLLFEREKLEYGAEQKRAAIEEVYKNLRTIIEDSAQGDETDDWAKIERSCRVEGRERGISEWEEQYEAGRLAEKRRIASVLLARYADEVFVADVTELPLATIYEIQSGIETLVELVNDRTLTVEKAAEEAEPYSDLFMEELKSRVLP